MTEVTSIPTKQLQKPTPQWIKNHYSTLCRTFTSPNNTMCLEGDKNKIAPHFWAQQIQKEICNYESGFQAKCSNWHRNWLDEQLKFWLRLLQQCRKLFFSADLWWNQGILLCKTLTKCFWSGNKQFCFVWNTWTPNRGGIQK